MARLGTPYCGASGNKFDSWTFSYFASSPPGRFAIWMIRHLDVSHICRFDTRRFATCLDVSPRLKVCNLRYCQNFFVVRWRKVQKVSETSWYRIVQRCETSRWRNVQVANRLRWWRNVLLPKIRGSVRLAYRPELTVQAACDVQLT